MNPRNRVLAALNHEIPDRIPIDLGGPANSLAASVIPPLSSHFSYQHHDLKIWHPILQLPKIPENLLQHLEIDTRHIHVTPPISPQWQTSSPTKFTDWLGIQYSRQGSIFVPKAHPLSAVKSIQDIDHYPWPHPKASWFRNTAKEAREHYSNKYAIIADPAIPGIFELGCWLMGWQHFLALLIQAPETAIHLLDRILELHIAYWEYFLTEIGEYVQIVLLGDDYGTDSGPFMRPQLFQELINPRLEKLVSSIKQQGSFSIMLHSCGAIHQLIPHLIASNIDVLSPIQQNHPQMQAQTLKTRYGDKLVFHGGVDLVSFEQKSRNERKQILRTLLEALTSEGGYIFGLTHSVLEPTQAVLFLEIFDYVKQY